MLESNHLWSRIEIPIFSMYIAHMIMRIYKAKSREIDEVQKFQMRLHIDFQSTIICMLKTMHLR